MTDSSTDFTQDQRGGAPVGFLTELGGVEAASVVYLRLWCDGPEGQTQVWQDFASSLGVEHGQNALTNFEDLCRMFTQHGRRPLMRHGVQCKCLGADESCFANFIGAAACGAREDAMLMAMLMVRPDFAPMTTALATDFGLALKRMNLRAPRDLGRNLSPTHPHHATLH